MVDHFNRLLRKVIQDKGRVIEEFPDKHLVAAISKKEDVP